MHNNRSKGLALSLSKGFTLIELLVVIAIIGVLSSVVLASLNTARNKGADAAVKSNLAGARAEAEIYYDSTAGANKYTNVCDSTATNNIFDSATAAKNAVGATSVTRDAVGSATVVACNDSDSGWAIQSPLKDSTLPFYCVDSSGTAKANATTLIADVADVTC
ncbi:MAG: type II secretion system protein [Candidatus Paceibacterota bacterium]|jgi:type IV pilus assembly protein PilE